MRIERGAHRAEIVGRWAGGIFIRAWLNGSPLGFGPQGTIETERVRLTRGGKVDRFALANPLDDALRVARFAGRDGGRSQIIPGTIGNTVTIARPNAGTGTAPIDGNVYRGLALDETWATIRDTAAGSGTNATDTDDNVALNASTTTDQWAVLRRAIIGFNTSPISTDDVHSALLQLYGAFSNATLATPELCLVSAAPASESAIATGDYDSLGTTEYASRFGQGSWSTSGFNDLALNAAGLAYLSTSGNTMFGLRTGWDLDNSPPTWSSGAVANMGWISADTAGITQDPVLTIVHGGGGALAGDAGLAGGCGLAGAGEGILVS